jgi:hypothetical protein
MSVDNDHIKTLIDARDFLVNQRRVLSVQLLRNKKPKATAEFVEVQNAIAATEEALKHERSLAARPQEATMARPYVANTPRTTTLG